MKKLKLFLTIYTFSLAIAAVAATNIQSGCMGYTQDPATGLCTRESSILCSCTVGTGCVDGSFNQLYRFNAGPCDTPLERNQE